MPTRIKNVLLAALFIIPAVVLFGFSAHAQNATLVPAGVTVTALPPSQISISWSAVTENSGTIQDYYVYRNGTFITATAGTSFVDSGLTPGFYNYAIAAYDANDNLFPQSPPKGVSLIADTTPPSTPGTPVVSGNTVTNNYYSPTTITISWPPSTDNVSVVGYHVYRNGMRLDTGLAPIVGTSVTDTVVPGTYAYTVTAYDASQNFSNQSSPLTVTITIDSVPPSTPANVSGTQSSANGIDLWWATSTDPIGVAGYQIFRDGVQVATSGGPPYTDPNLSPGSGYNYTVAAYDAAGNISSRSAPGEVAVQQANGPSVPSGLAAMLLGTSSVQVSWNQAMDTFPITGYSLFRDAVEIVDFVTSTNYLDQTVASGTHTYAVNSTDVLGLQSAESPLVSVVVPDPGPLLLSTTTVSVVASSSSAPVVILSTATSTPAAVSASTVSSSALLFTQFLYFGLKSPQVASLQSLLAGHGYLGLANATGFFGNLTLRALQQFQCDQAIVCTGGPGWGMVGPKTRGALNALPQNSSVTISVVSSSVAAQLAALEAELSALEKQQGL